MIHKKLFFLFVLLLPSQLALYFWPDYAFVYGLRVDYLAPAIYFIDLVWALTFLAWFMSTEYRLSILLKYRYVIGMFILLALANTVFSQLPWVSFYKWGRVALMLSLALYIHKQKNVLETIRTPLLISLCVVLVLALFQVLRSSSIGGLFYLLGERSFNANTPGIALASIFGREFLRPYSTFPHPNALGGYALVTLFLYIHQKHFASRAIALVSILLVILSFSQNAWLALFMAPLVLPVVSKLKLAKLKFVVSSVLASLFLTISGFMFSFTSRELVQRAQLNEIAGRLVATFPLVGVGLGAFPAMVGEFSSNGTGWWLQPVHNIFLLLISEVGFVGLLLSVFAVVTRMNKINTLAVIAIVLTGMFDHYWLTLTQTSYLLFLVLGLTPNSAKIEK